MAKFDDKVNGNTVDDTEYNNIVRASKNAIEDSGQVIDATNTQLSKAIANYVGTGNFYTDSGTANTYVLTNIGSLKAPTAYTDGMEVRFRAGNANTTASTVNVGTIGVKNVKKPDGTTDVTAGDIPTANDTILRYDLGNDVFLISDNSQFSNITINNKFNTQKNTETIASGAITYSGAYIEVDTESAAATDDLDTISGATAGDRVVISIADSARNVVIKDGTGNIELFDNRDITLDFTVDSVELMYNGSNWIAINRIDQDFAALLSTNGYTYLPKGMILQWGQQAVSGNTTYTQTLPITYPNSHLLAISTFNETLTAISSPSLAQRTSTSQIKITNCSGGVYTINWFSMGY